MGEFVNIFGASLAAMCGGVLMHKACKIAPRRTLGVIVGTIAGASIGLWTYRLLEHL